MPAFEKLPSVSHPWASFAPCFQSHTSVCSFQQVSKSVPSLRPLRLRNFKEQSLILFAEFGVNVHLHADCECGQTAEHHEPEEIHVTLRTGRAE